MPASLPQLGQASQVGILTDGIALEGTAFRRMEPPAQRTALRRMQARELLGWVHVCAKTLRLSFFTLNVKQISRFKLQMYLCVPDFRPAGYGSVQPSGQADYGKAA